MERYIRHVLNYRNKVITQRKECNYNAHVTIGRLFYTKLLMVTAVTKVKLNEY